MATKTKRDRDALGTAAPDTVARAASGKRQAGKDAPKQSAKKAAKKSAKRSAKQSAAKAEKTEKKAPKGAAKPMSTAKTTKPKASAKASNKGSKKGSNKGVKKASVPGARRAAESTSQADAASRPPPGGQGPMPGPFGAALPSSLAAMMPGGLAALVPPQMAALMSGGAATAPSVAIPGFPAGLFTTPFAGLAPAGGAGSGPEPARHGAADAMPLHIDQAKLAGLQHDYLGHAQSLWERYARGEAPPLQDKRFGSPEWQAHPQFGWQAAWYLMNADYLKQMAELVDADRKTRERVRFFTQQWVDALSPANFLATNPDAQAAMIETGGESLRSGIENLLDDLQHGRISQTDLDAFEVGRNVGTSPGQVVYENELIQLIQYQPSTSSVAVRPLLIVPPCINKFYILDLQPDNSFIGHAVAQGNTVFVVSWRNVKAPQGKLTWDDYLQMGVVDPIDVVRRICSVDQINALGFCVGGTILCAALAAMAARGDRPAASLTLLTTLLDFDEPGTLGVFIDEMHVAMRDAQLGHGGIMPGKDLATTFSFLRPNDLVWNYVVSNYLKGKSPPPFDLLFWNADSTNLPGPMFCWYLRHMYLQNELKIPGRLQSLGQPLDLTRIGAPAYVLSTREDHIVPWPGGFASAQALGGDPRFVLGASGHIAGVINPATKNKRSFWTGPPIAGQTPDAWFDAATEHPGSWWTDWSQWLARHEGGRVAARLPLGSAAYQPIEPAPGRYVREKAD